MFQMSRTNKKLKFLTAVATVNLLMGSNDSYTVVYPRRMTAFITAWIGENYYV